MNQTQGVKVLVVEDVPELLEDLEFSIARMGHEVCGAGDAAAFWAAFPRLAPHVVVLDIGLPGEDGLQIARRVRKAHPEVGIVMLTGRSLPSDRIQGREVGADVYLSKPVQMDELQWVLHNLSRRLPARPAGWILDAQALTLSAPTGGCMALTHAELQVMRALAEGADHQASRRGIVESLGHQWLTYDERRLEAIVSRLKRKLGAEFQRADPPIRSLRGQGYAFTEPLSLA